jgi:hypothetical protein
MHVQITQSMPATITSIGWSTTITLPWPDASRPRCRSYWRRQLTKASSSRQAQKNPREYFYSVADKKRAKQLRRPPAMMRALYRAYYSAQFGSLNGCRIAF